MNKFTHRELCEIGAKFLRRSESANGHGCHFAIVEPASYGENPDVFGIRHGLNGYDIGTVLLEAKTSRSDFLADKKKPHRLNPAMGVGKWRYFICPKDLIKPEELPEKWGLIYVSPKGICKIIAGAMAVKKQKHVSDWCKEVRYWRNGQEVEQSFIKYSFEERNIQNETNILTMALARLGNAEELLYMQRNHHRIAMRLQNLEHQNMLLERRVKGEPTDVLIQALNKLKTDDELLRKPINNVVNEYA